MPRPTRLPAAIAVAMLPACRPAATPEPPPTAAVDPPMPEPDPDGDVPIQAPPDAVERMLAEVSPQTLRDSVDRLAAFGTRHTLSADAPDRGIAAARRWLAERLRDAGPRLSVDLDVHRIAPDGRRIDREVDVVNVVATLPGSMPEAAARRYYVIGHYDSRASDPMDRDADAPGANDDASGVAVVLELARVMASRSFDATIVFMATAGEEQGLVGARRHAEAAAAAGLDIRAVLSNDIVGDPSGPRGDDRTRVRLFSEGLPTWIDDAALAAIRRAGAEHDSSSRQLARYVDTIARWHALPVQPRIVMRHDRFLRGGDHSAFNDLGFSAVRLTEVAEDYDRQHQDVRTDADGRRYGDLPEHVDERYLAGVAQVNLAALAHLANAPSSPGRAVVVADTLSIDTTLRWQPAPEPDVDGYEVVWRPTTQAWWTDVLDVGDVTEATLPVAKDDVLFGVRSYDRDGYRSPVAFCGL